LCSGWPFWKDCILVLSSLFFRLDIPTAKIELTAENAEALAKYAALDGQPPENDFVENVMAGL
jgi:hypothetical protein